MRLADLYFGIQQYRQAFDNYRKALQIRERYAADRRVHQDVLLLQLAHVAQQLGLGAVSMEYGVSDIRYHDIRYQNWIWRREGHARRSLAKITEEPLGVRSPHEDFCLR